MKKYLLYAVLILTFGAGVYGAVETKKFIAQQNAAVQEEAITLKPETGEALSSSDIALDVKSLDVVTNANKYLNKTIKMKASFDKFSTLGLDYKPAMRKSDEYIGVLIRRDDVTDHVVPLSEMKLFMKRKTAEKFIDLESGDVVEIEGKVFSTALGDPWIDITKLTVISSKKPIKES